MTHQPYEQWLAERRDVSPPSTLADQIMSQVAELESASVAPFGGCAWSSGSNSHAPPGGPCAAERSPLAACRLSF